MRIGKLTRWVTLGGVGSLVICSPVLAQTTGDYSIVDTPAVAAAPSHYSFNGTFESEYQSNVAGGDAAVAALRGLKQEDIVFTPTLLVDAFKPFGRESVFLVGSVGYNFYDRNTILNRESFNLSGGVNGQLSICRATATGGYVRRQNELQDTTLVRIKDTYDQTSVGLEGACGRGFGFSPTFSVSQTWSNNSLTALQSSNYKTLGGSGGVSYQAPTLGNLSLFGQYQTTNFTNRLVLFNQNAVQDGFDTYGGGVKYARLLGARIQGTVSLSYTSVKPFVGNTSGFNGVTYGADITFRASSRLDFHGSFNRDVQPSNVLDSTYYLETKSLLEGTYHIGSRLDANLGVSEADRTFKGSALLTNFDLRDDTLKTVFGALTYKLRRFYVALNLRNEARAANVTGLSYTDNRVGLTAGTSF
jgi:Putative beta-barrel porin 2